MKLEWEENPSEQVMTWHEAMEYAKNLGSGWRLPTIQELYSAWYSGVDGFKDTTYWSSSMHAQDTEGVWYMDFSNGFVFAVYKTDYNYVRCVRVVK